MTRPLLLALLLTGCHPSPVCEPTAQRCLEGDVWTCSSAGAWELSVDCPEDGCGDVPADAYGAAGSACGVTR